VVRPTKHTLGMVPLKRRFWGNGTDRNTRQKKTPPHEGGGRGNLVMNTNNLSPIPPAAFRCSGRELVNPYRSQKAGFLPPLRY
jgi:hypothetical protein